MQFIDTVLLCIAWAVIGYALALIENEWEIAKYERDSHDDLSNARKELHTSKERRTRDDPAGRRRDCVGDRNRQPTGDAIPPRAARPAA